MLSQKLKRNKRYISQIEKKAHKIMSVLDLKPKYYKENAARASTCTDKILRNAVKPRKIPERDECVSPAVGKKDLPKSELALEPKSASQWASKLAPATEAASSAPGSASRWAPESAEGLCIIIIIINEKEASKRRSERFRGRRSNSATPELWRNYRIALLADIGCRKKRTNR